MSTKKTVKKDALIIYTGQNGKVELRADTDKDTIWATQDQIAELFDVQRPAITKHLRNVFSSDELKEDSVSSILEHTAEDGKQYKVKFYNLDAILSVGYRVNSKKATQFRVWATRTLREYLMKGFVANTDRIKRLPDKILSDLDEKIGFIQRTIGKSIHITELGKSEVDGLLSVIHDYANSWSMFKEYDEGDLAVKQSKQKEKRRFDYYFVRDAIDRLKINLVEKSEASELFSSERDGSFQGILRTIYQTFDGKELYPSLEIKAAHLLYFIIKDHPFSDGNKRVGAFLFVLFLDLNGILRRSIKGGFERKINDNALVALALLIAESDPKEKDVMVALTTNLLV